MESCPICLESVADDRPTVRLGQKGCTGILEANNSKACDVKVTPGDVVHIQCRKEFTRPCSNGQEQDCSSNASQRALRSDQVNFDFKTKCLFCSTHAKFCSTSRKRSLDVYPVRSLDFQKTILKHCIQRADQWADEVNSRLSQILDLPAADAIYHQKCNVNFRTGKNVPKQFQTQDQLSRLMKSPGRPEDTEQASAFQQVIQIIETSENSTVTVNSLVKTMADICGEKAYSNKHMKKKIIEHFGDSVVVSGIGGKSDMVTLRQSVSSIVHTFYETSKELSDDDKKQTIIETAAKLIKNDINALESSTEFYPSVTDVSSAEKNLQFLPQSLKTLLEKLFPANSDTKLASVGQSIVQGCRPKGLLAPLQVGLGVQLHHHFGSRFLIDTLNGLGFSCSYWEVQKFESNAAALLSTRIPCQEAEGPFLQFIADNVDHNVRTLDGHNTFHGMGIISTSTPGSEISVCVPRLDISLEEVSAIGKIDIKYFTKPHEATESPVFHDLPAMQSTYHCEPMDFFAKVIWPLRQDRPSWSGFMQMFEQDSGSYPQKSTITFMPMIDLNPSDVSCIYTTLSFVSEQAQRYGKTPVLTFDQPLYQKAMDIICAQISTSPLKKTVLRLGAFHTEMSFLGCIGHLMAGSGIKELLETVYAPNAVTHMMSGKAIQRAIRGHMLVDNALTVLQLESALICHSNDERDCPQETEMIGPQEPEISLDSSESSAEQGVPDCYRRHQDLNNLAVLYDNLTKDASTVQNVLESESLQLIQTEMQTKRLTLAQNRTARLWMQYMDMVSILQQFIRAERTGNWQLHLVALRKMLPYFAASGHNLYLKSAYIYLQSMLQLQATNPDVYAAFETGLHVIRRSDRYWAGLSTDLLIEQVLMRSVKATGGLTRGRGMSENQRAMWLFSMPVCLQLNNAMQDFTKTSYQTSEQHKETGKSRIARDSKDMNSMLTFLRERNPFTETDKELRNIETGVSAEETVNVDCAEAIGESIVKDMVGKSSATFSFKRSLQAVTLNERCTVKVSDGGIHIDTQLLFQRLTTAANRYVEDVSEAFKYELCSMPSSLFDNSGLPREPQKATLAEAIWKQGDCAGMTNEPADPSTCFVIDGGSLLHRLPWSRGSTFGEICSSYSEYLRRNFQGQITVVFDGYTKTPTTKDVTHFRRSKGRIGTAVKFSIETPCRMKKETFLNHPENKQNFIFMLGECLMGDGMAVCHAEDDADHLIATTALDSASTSNVTVVGEDTDILVLLLHHYSLDLRTVVFKSASRRMADKKGRIWDIGKTRLLLGEELCRYLPLLHALTGCDTTSRMFGISKAFALKVLKTNPIFLEICRDFLSSLQQSDVHRFGERLLVTLYGGTPSENLDSLRHRKFSTKVISSATSVQVQSLPPTSAAASFHCLRVFYQSRVWMGAVSLNPLDYGWQVEDGMMMPLKTTLPPAPEKLLKIIRCSCKVNCDSKKCTCRKHGLQCSSACGDCKGVSCSNSFGIVEFEALIEDEAQTIN